MKKIIYIIIFLLLISIIFNIIYYNKYNNILYNKNNIDTVEIVKVDSFIKKDTLYYPKPYPKIVRVVDTMYIDKDSIQQEGDSILLPREEKTYTDDSTYNVRISGFKPKLEEITIFPKTYTIEKTKTVTVTKKQHWNYGVGLGMGYGLFNRKFDIYAGFTVGYTF